MADVISRLKLESGEFDSKVKRATQGLLQMEQGCRKVNGTLAVLEKDQKQYVQSLGQMQTVATTIRGKLGELTQAYTELSVQYKRLTDEEKKGDFGKALNASLEQLKSRINEAKGQLNDVGKELSDTGEKGNTTSGALDELAGKFGLNIKQLGIFGIALGTAKGALDITKGAIESNEATHDSLARAIAATDSVTNQFLRSLANADFSNFLDGLDSIITKAIQAYNTLDTFESYAARFNPKQQAQEAKVQTLLMQARAAKAQGDNTKAKQLAADAQKVIQELSQTTKTYGKMQTEAGYSAIRDLMGTVNITDQQIAWYADPKNWEDVNKKAQKFAETQERINKLTSESKTGRKSGETEMGYLMRTGGAARQANALRKSLANDPSLQRAYTFQNLRDGGDTDEGQRFLNALNNIYGNTIAESRVEGLKARADRIDGMLSGAGSNGKKGSKTEAKDEFTEIIGLIPNAEEAVKSLQEQIRTSWDEGEIKKLTEDLKVAEAELKRLKDLSNESGADKFQNQFSTLLDNVGFDSIGAEMADRMRQSMADMLVERNDNLLADAMRMSITSGVSAADFTEAAMLIKQKMMEGGEITQEDWQSFVDQLNEKIENTDLKLQFDVDTKKLTTAAEKQKREAKNMTTSWQSASAAINAVGQAMNQIDDPAAKVLGTIAQAVATMALSYAQAAASPAVTGTGWGWIAFAATGVATMLSSIAAIKSATSKYAEGGIVPGNLMSMDQMPAMVSSGELILNRAQQGIIASQLQDGGMYAGTPQVRLTGEEMFIVINNYLQRAGRGEILTSR